MSRGPAPAKPANQPAGRRAPPAAPAPAARAARAAPVAAAPETEIGPLFIQSVARPPLRTLSGSVTETDDGFILSVRRRQSQKTDDTLFRHSAVVAYCVGDDGFIVTDESDAVGPAFGMTLDNVVENEDGTLTGTTANGAEVVVNVNRMPIRRSFMLT